MLDLKENKIKAAEENFHQSWIVYSSLSSPLAHIALWARALVRYIVCNKGTYKVSDQPHAVFQQALDHFDPNFVKYIADVNSFVYLYKKAMESVSIADPVEKYKRTIGPFIPPDTLQHNIDILTDTPVRSATLYELLQDSFDILYISSNRCLHNK